MSASTSSAKGTAPIATSPHAYARNRTRAPGGTQLVMLFDGHCRFCTQSANKLARAVGPERVKTVSFQEDGVLASFPGIAYADCMKKLYVVSPEGYVYSGAGAIARLLRTLRFVGWLTYIYYVPVLRQLADLAYAFVAKYRYKLFGKTQQCDGGTCHLHG